MTFTTDLHHRRSIRLKNFDYSAGGGYFVTLCAWQRECLFGEVVAGMVQLNESGALVMAEWLRTPVIRPQVVLDAFVVMPNHFHAIVFIDAGGAGAHRPAPDPLCRTTTGAHVSAPLRRESGTLGSVVAGFKSAATKRINVLRGNLGGPVWQRNYYEHVIRDARDLEAIQRYISDNPMKWAEDENHPARG